MSRHVGDGESPGPRDMRDTCVNTACPLSSRDKAGVTHLSDDIIIRYTFPSLLVRNYSFILSNVQAHGL